MRLETRVKQPGQQSQRSSSRRLLKAKLCPMHTMTCHSATERSQRCAVHRQLQSQGPGAPGLPTCVHFYIPNLSSEASVSQMHEYVLPSWLHP